MKEPSATYSPLADKLMVYARADGVRSIMGLQAALIDAAIALDNSATAARSARVSETGIPNDGIDRSLYALENNAPYLRAELPAQFHHFFDNVLMVLAAHAASTRSATLSKEGDTPRTDAEARKPEGEKYDVVDADVSRQLERELAAMTADRDMWLRDSAKQNDNLGRVIAERDALRSATRLPLWMPSLVDMAQTRRLDQAAACTQDSFPTIAKDLRDLAQEIRRSAEYVDGGRK